MGIMFVAGCVTMLNGAAATVFVPNHSFEAPVVPASGYTTTAPSGWSGAGTQSFGVQKIYDSITGVTGAQTGYLNGVGTSMWSATDLITIALGETYTLDVDAWDRPVWPANGFKIELGNSDFSQILSSTGIVNPEGTGVSTYTLVYTPNALDSALGSGLRVRITNTGGQQVLFDNIRLDVIPEPSAAVLGVAGLLLAGRRRRS